MEMKEFMAWAENSKAKTFFEAELGIDVYKAGQTFRMLDIDDTGTIEKEEFVAGCLRLTGSSKAVDAELQMRSMKRLKTDVQIVKSQVDAIWRGMNPNGDGCQL